MKETVVTQHLVKNIDLNHHKTLFAGRSAEWLIETAFITASSILPADSIVASRIHEVCYLAPVYAGNVLKYEGHIVHAGKTSLMIYVLGETGGKLTIEGFITFVHIGEDSHAVPHGITVEAETEEEKVLQERAKKLLSC